MNRLPPLQREQMSDQQRVLVDDIIESRGPSFMNTDGSLQGPFDALLRSPELGDAIQKVGAQIRFNGSLSGPIREVAILVCAQYWQANYEWWVHRKLAESEGVDAGAVEAIYAGNPPQDAEFSVVHTFISELNQSGKVSDQTYADTHSLLGEKALVELTLLSGFYAMVSQVLNVFEIPLPDGEKIPFPETE